MLHSRYRILLFLAALAAAVLPSMGQVDPLLSQYYEVPSYYNPGAIGYTDNVRLRALGRMQWLGIDNAPRTIMGTANMPLKLLGKRIGVGVTLQQQSEGLYSGINAAAQVGYKLKLLKGEMTVGLQAGYFSEAFKGSKVFIPDNDDYHQSGDEAIPTTDVHGGALDLGVGVFYSHRLFWAGVSCQHLLSPTVKLQGEGTQGTGGSAAGAGQEGEGIKNFEFTVPRTLYFMAGCNIPIKNTLFEVMPSIMVASDLTFYTGQATARLRYNKFLYASIGYRYNDGITAMIGAEFKGFYIGYSYDYATSAIAKASSGSHEVTLGYSLKLDFSDKNRHRHKNIRIM